VVVAGEKLEKKEKLIVEVKVEIHSENEKKQKEE